MYRFVDGRWYNIDRSFVSPVHLWGYLRSVYQASAFDRSFIVTCTSPHVRIFAEILKLVAQNLGRNSESALIVLSVGGGSLLWISRGKKRITLTKLSRLRSVSENIYIGPSWSTAWDLFHSHMNLFWSRLCVELTKVFGWEVTLEWQILHKVHGLEVVTLYGEFAKDFAAHVSNCFKAETSMEISTTFLTCQSHWPACHSDICL